MKKLMAIVIAVCMFGAAAFAQQFAPGVIMTDVNWSGEIWVKGDVVVEKGATLTIMPGTRVMFLPVSDENKSGADPARSEITVRGRLIAQGTRNTGRIIFTSGGTNPQMNDWSGIVLKNPRTPSVLNNCLIEYAYKGVNCYGSSPEVSECEIRYNLYAGISCEVRANAVIRKNSITSNEFAGVVCELASNPILEQNIITQNTNGVIIFDRSQPNLGTVNYTRGSSRGENLILNNFEANIYNHSANDILAQNNLWNTSNPADIAANIYDKRQNSTKGEILFLPVFEAGGAAQPAIAQSRPTRPSSEPATGQRQEAPPQQPVDNTPPPVQSQPVNNPVASNRSNTGNTQPPAENPATGNSSGASANASPSQPDNDDYLASSRNSDATSLLNPGENAAAASGPPATNPAVNNPPAQTQSPATQPALDLSQPIIEALLDSRSREYIHRETASYPRIYQQTKHQGKVLLEVVVAQDGSVESYRVLKSDGEFFTDSVIDAIKKFKYKPGTFKGQPVRYKIVEPFVFRIEN